MVSLDDETVFDVEQGLQKTLMNVDDTLRHTVRIRCISFDSPAFAVSAPASFATRHPLFHFTGVAMRLTANETMEPSVAVGVSPERVQSITPSLPLGLALHDGVLSGVPREASPFQQYTVVASEEMPENLSANLSANRETTIWIGVEGTIASGRQS